ncbi:MAG: cytochrome c [Lysobacteraceae bacterium]
MKRHTEHLFVLSAALALIAIGLALFGYSSLYNIGADDPHWPVTHNLLESVRDRSIHVRSRSLPMPDLKDPQLILKGAGQYAAMCTGCHLAPGMNQSELRPGLYPQPPDLSKARLDPRDEFWVIKHGIKMSAMPAWGGSHDDATIWSMVAFLQRLPDLTPAQYKDIVARAPPDEDMDMEMDMSRASGRTDNASSLDAQPEPAHNHGHHPTPPPAHAP